MAYLDCNELSINNCPPYANRVDVFEAVSNLCNNTPTQWSAVWPVVNGVTLAASANEQIITISYPGDVNALNGTSYTGITKNIATPDVRTEYFQNVSNNRVHLFKKGIYSIDAQITVSGTANGNTALFLLSLWIVEYASSSLLRTISFDHKLFQNTANYNTILAGATGNRFRPTVHVHQTFYHPGHPTGTGETPGYCMFARCRQLAGGVAAESVITAFTTDTPTTPSILTPGVSYMRISLLGEDNK